MAIDQDSRRSGTIQRRIANLTGTLAAAGAAIAATAIPKPAGATDLGAAIADILAIGPEGEGNAAAATAWSVLGGAGAADIPALLGAIDHAGPLSANYLRSAADAIAQRALADGEDLPVAALGSFLFDTSHAPRARQQAFEILKSAVPDTAGALVPGFLNDPDPALRRNAVAQLIDAASATEGEAKSLLLQQALGAARDADQVTAIADELEELGLAVDLPRHFGFIMRWKSIGPFDNTGRKGFDQVFPPEEGIDLDATYPGKDSEVAWSDFTTAHRFGIADLNKAYTPLKEAAGYLYTEFDSETSRPAEIRIGCKNAWKLWVNGQYLFGRDEYHRGMRIDQYSIPCQLEAGTNTILVKLCQNEQEEQWTVQWEAQVRVCDASGTAILSADRAPTPAPEEATGAPQRRRPPGRTADGDDNDA